ncbi:hypothetical protein FEM48_Zijuj10G0091700 [Ziziphus jujuba var. spinosa]|uniref:RPW8 domain-containing protein n=1 Tax=Ziziphus jujuba var. spinosa TaxID=714518 RepID=A0A978UMI2_ZIZJJ|nr:hypothetical protein FEM48_Zijuj10G0091700 [Ziziphus jujuba var. spinosa]
MAGELGWAAVEAALGVLFDKIKELVVGNVMFEKTLKSLMTKLNILKPAVIEIMKLNKLAESEDESAYYESLIKERVEPLRRVKKFWYIQKLKELDRTLELLIPFAYSKRDIKEILIRTRKTSAETHEQQGICIGQPYQDTSQKHDVGQGWTAHIRVAVGSILDVIKESNGKD